MVDEHTVACYRAIWSLEDIAECWPAGEVGKVVWDVICLGKDVKIDEVEREEVEWLERS